jgi:hypothetical protein
VEVTAKVAQKIADAFSTDDDLDLKYVVNPDIEAGSFDLDVEAGPNTPGEDWKDVNGFGIGNYLGDLAGGSFYIKDGVVYNAASRNAPVANVTPEGEVEMISAADSRAAIGMDDEIDMDRYNDDLDMKDDELNPGMYIDDEEWEREMGRMEEGEMDNFEAKLPQDIEAMAQELGGFWLYNGSLDGHFLNSEDKEKSRERDIFLGLSIAYFADEDLLNIMDPINGETLSKERDPKKAIKVIKQNAMGLEENKEETKSNKMKKSELKEMIRAAMLAEMEVEETKVFEAEEDEDVEVAVSDEEEMDIEEPAEDEGEVEVEDNAKTELTGDKKDVSDNLEAALEAARALGDEKLVDQIGNTITFFTRAHIVKEDELQDEAEEMLQESLRMKRLAGLIK